jgi:hypothetical protein
MLEMLQLIYYFENVPQLCLLLYSYMSVPKLNNENFIVEFQELLQYSNSRPCLAHIFPVGNY